MPATRGRCGATSIEVTQQAHDAHNDRIEELMQDLIWTHEHVRHLLPQPNRPHHAAQPFTATDFWDMNQRPTNPPPAARRARAGALRQDVGGMSERQAVVPTGSSGT